MNKYGIFLLVALLTVVLPLASTASGVQVTLFNFYLGGESCLLYTSDAADE